MTHNLNPNKFNITCFKCGQEPDGNAFANNIMLATCSRCHTVWPIEGRDITKLNDTPDVKKFFFGNLEND